MLRPFVRSKLDHSLKVIKAFSGCEKFYTNEKEKIDLLYTETWIDINSKSLLEILANGGKTEVGSRKFEINQFNGENLAQNLSAGFTLNQASLLSQNINENTTQNKEDEWNENIVAYIPPSVKSNENVEMEEDKQSEHEEDIKSSSEISNSHNQHQNNEDQHKSNSSSDSESDQENSGSDIPSINDSSDEDD